MARVERSRRCINLVAIWARCGGFLEGLHNITLPGQEGQARIAELMADLRNQVPTQFAGISVAFVDDYATGTSLELAGG